MARFSTWGSRIWNANGHFQSALGVPAMWSTVTTGAAAVLATIAPLPWHWKLLLFLGLAVGFIWSVVGIYTLFLYDRLVRTRQLRALLRDAGHRLAQLGSVEYSSSVEFRDVMSDFLVESKCDILMMMALKHWAAKDYDHYVEVAEYRAKQEQTTINKRQLKSAYILTLCDRLTFDMIEPTFYLPPTLESFLKRKVVLSDQAVSLE